MVMVASAGNSDTYIGQSEGADSEGADSEGADSGQDCGVQQVKYPARYAETIGVGATDGDGRVTPYSIRGEEVDLVAPGGTRTEPIISTMTTAGSLEVTGNAVAASEGADSEGADSEGADSEGADSSQIEYTPYYGTASGTSQAAAHVTGVVALLLGVNPELTPDDVLQILQKTAMDLGEPVEAQGAGLLDAAQAVKEVRKERHKD
ncbi:MAG: hypothetical protein D6736_03505 [Nitrospinota bacterium]|nr:MAG: hypothetical protein D6736_03505 [Nitrospinota bacterium]